MRRAMRWMPIVALVGLAAVAGCDKGGTGGTPTASSGSAGGSASASGGSTSIAVISPALTSVFHQELVKGAQAEAEAKGWKFSHLEPDKETNSAMQVSQVKDSLQGGVGAISICAVNDEALVQAVKSANAANVPIFVHNSITPVPGGKVAAYIGYDEHDGGLKIGQKAVELLKAKYAGVARGTVAVLEGTAGSHTDAREGGFRDALKGTQITVVAHPSANWAREEGVARTSELLEKYPNLDLVFGCSDAMAQGAAKAAQQAGKKIFTVGIDGNPDALADVKAGTLTATLVVFPRKMGATVIDTIEKVKKGESVPQIIKTDSSVVDKSNIDQILAEK